MSITEQYLEATRKMQENWFSAVDAMTSQFSKQFDRPSTAQFGAVDPRKAVDEMFDFYGRALAVQRETAHKLLDANQQLTEQWNSQAEQFYTAWRDQAKTMTETARHQMETFAESAREQAAQFGQVVEAKVAEAQAATREQAERITTATAEQTQRLASAAAEQTARMTGADAENTAAMTNAAAENTERATEAASAQVKRNFNLMNTAQLKSELSSRGLDTTGSLDELRARLREADAKA